jgi:hypothetical protein
VATYFGAFLLAAEFWTLMVGLASVFGIFRRRSRVSRLGCLFLGGVVAFTFPVAAFIAANMLIAPSDLSAIGATAMIGLFAIPFGVLGGWMFWRIAIRPAPLPSPVVAQVFD